MKFSILLIIICAALGCAQPLHKFSGKKTEGSMIIVPAGTLTVAQILAEPKIWDGKLVRVWGYYYFKTPSSILFNQKSDFFNQRAEHSLWIGPNCTESPEENTDRENSGYVIIVGVFRLEPVGPFDLFPAQIKCVQQFEPTRPKNQN